MKKGLLALILLAAMAVIGLPSATASAGTKTEISVNADVQSVIVGEEYAVYVNAANVTDVYGLDAIITYDTQLAELVKAKCEELPANAYGYTKTEALAANEVQAIFSLLGQVPGLSTDGRIYKLVFKAKARGIAEFRVKSAEAADSKPEEILLNVSTDVLSVAQKDYVYDPLYTPEQKEQIKGFVTRMYTVALDRAGDADGIAFWQQRLEKMEMDGADIAEQFFNSEEFQGTTLTNQEFLNRLYKTFFDREPDEEGYNFWLGLLNGGASRDVVLTDFINSLEFDTICKSYGIVPGKAADPIKAFVKRLYTCILERDGDLAGIQYYTKAIRDKVLTPEVASLDMIGSKEYLDKNTTNAKHVEILYATFMNRQADADGKAYWVTLLQNNTTNRTDIVLHFCNSAEFTEVKRTFGLVE